MKTKIVLLLFFSLTLCLKMRAQFSFTNMQDVIDNVKRGREEIKRIEETTFTVDQKRRIIEEATKISGPSVKRAEEITNIIDRAEDYGTVKNNIEKSSLSEEEKIKLRNFVFSVLKKSDEQDPYQLQDNSDSQNMFNTIVLTDDQKQKIVAKINTLSVSNKEELIKKISSAVNYKAVKDAIRESNLKESEDTSLRGFIFKIIWKTEENKGTEGSRPVKVLFPARFNEWGSERSTIFFEGQTEYTQFFQNNNVVYNPNLKNLSFNSEVVNDYLGPFRVGIGFQFSSTVKNNDSLKVEQVKKDELVSSLQNGGGNLFINIKYPIIALGHNSSFGLKSYVYHNTGVELTKVNEADNEFLLTNNTGIAVGGFAVGQKKQISAFFEAKAAILYGNSKFNAILSADPDFRKVLPLFNLGVGINFLDMYTVKAEFYPAGSYIKRNFPATISFIIVPKTK